MKLFKSIRKTIAEANRLNRELNKFSGKEISRHDKKRIEDLAYVALQQHLINGGTLDDLDRQPAVDLSNAKKQFGSAAARWGVTPAEFATAMKIY